MFKREKTFVSFGGWLEVLYRVIRCLIIHMTKRTEEAGTLNRELLTTAQTSLTLYQEKS